MKHLYVLRHAKAVSEELGMTDHDRPLSDRGKKEAKKMGEILAKLTPQPTCILCSTSKRTRKTAKRMMKGAGWDLEIQFVPELYLADIPRLEGALRHEAQTDCVMLIGHNPGLEMLVSRLSGEACFLPTAGLAQFELDLDDWSQFTLAQPARMVGFWPGPTAV